MLIPKTKKNEEEKEEEEVGDICKNRERKKEKAYYHLNVQFKHAFTLSHASLTLFIDLNLEKKIREE